MGFALTDLAWGLPQTVIALVALQRLSELWIAKRNTKRLLALGGQEIGAGHYPLFVLLHGTWLIALLFLVPAEAAVQPGLLVLFALLQFGRIWVIASLGRYWTTRIITLPEAPLVKRGPYKFLRHPNYVIVTAEIAVLPLAFGALDLAALFSALNALLLAHRIRMENDTLAPRKSLA